MIVNCYPIRNAKESTRSNDHGRINRREDQRHMALIYIYSLLTVQEHIYTSITSAERKKLYIWILIEASENVQESKNITQHHITDILPWRTKN